MGEVAKDKKCLKVKKLTQNITYHLYWSASTGPSGEEGGQVDIAFQSPTDLLTHDNPLFPKCLHAPDAPTNGWCSVYRNTTNYHQIFFRYLILLTSILSTKPVYKLEKQLLNKNLLKDVAKLSPVHQTSALESFHSLILRFTPKKVFFSCVGMLCRYITSQKRVFHHL